MKDKGYQFKKEGIGTSLKSFNLWPLTTRQIASSIRRRNFQVEGIRRKRPKKELAEVVREDMVANNLSKVMGPGKMK